MTCACGSLGIISVAAETRIWLPSSELACQRCRYFANHNMSDTVITLLVTYHEQRAEVPDFWKDAVTPAAAAAKRVILMTVRKWQRLCSRASTCLTTQ